MAVILESPPSYVILPSQMLRRMGLVKTVSSNSMKTKSNNKKSGVAKKDVSTENLKKRTKSLSRTAICFRDKITFYEIKMASSFVILNFFSKMFASFRVLILLT